jgi:alpha-D-ribose 1-methylphosphonate 5-triphosphate synthase subunit PhnH
MQDTALVGGFSNAAYQSAHAFRAAMSAMARPGQIGEITGATPPTPLSIAAGTLILTLCDPGTTLYLAGAYDCAAVRDWVTFHTGAPISAPQDCAFAVGAWANLLPLTVYPRGTPDYPDRSATLIVEMSDLLPSGACLRGPGIKEEVMLSLPDLAPFQDNARLYPQGLDFFLTAGAQLAALPRSTRVG